MDSQPVGCAQTLSSSLSGEPSKPADPFSPAVPPSSPSLLHSRTLHLTQGDKDLFRFAWLALRRRWGVPGRYVSVGALPRNSACISPTLLLIA